MNIHNLKILGNCKLSKKYLDDVMNYLKRKHKIIYKYWSSDPEYDSGKKFYRDVDHESDAE